MALTPADIDWSDGHPVSRLHGDIYGSREGWLEQARAVFVSGNDLIRRFAALPERGRLTVGEIGFGAGVNFLACVEAFVQHAPPSAQLAYVAFERHPLRPEDLGRLLSAFPELAEHAADLRRQWPALLPGPHRLRFLDGRVRLTLWWGGALEGLAALHAGDGVDGWFLDGFAPAKNPDAWEAALLAQVGRHSAPGATAATWSVATPVREGLQAAGFAVEKRPGFGAKREMLVAVRAGGRARDSPAAPPRAAWRSAGCR